MNKRIQELASAAENIADTKHLDTVIEGCKSDWHELFRQEFAELIIAECKTAIADLGGTASGFVGMAIDRHFGIN